MCCSKIQQAVVFWKSSGHLQQLNWDLELQAKANLHGHKKMVFAGTKIVILSAVLATNSCFSESIWIA